MTKMVSTTPKKDRYCGDVLKYDSLGVGVIERLLFGEWKYIENYDNHTSNISVIRYHHSSK